MGGGGGVKEPQPMVPKDCVPKGIVRNYLNLLGFLEENVDYGEPFRPILPNQKISLESPI